MYIIFVEVDFMNRIIRSSISLMLVLALVILHADAGLAKKLYPLEPNTFYRASVERVVDGDTCIVRYEDGSRERVRFIGVDTPESVKPNSPIEFYGREASEHTKQALTGKTVFLQTDVEVRDKYKRALAYVWLEMPKDHKSKKEIRAKMYNAHLLLDGFARVMTIQPNSRLADLFVTFEREARSANRGLWGAVTEADRPKP